MDRFLSAIHKDCHVPPERDLKPGEPRFQLSGVNRHFQMIAIHDKLSSSSKKITSGDIWKHLLTLYDLQALNESEIVPFPNKDADFSLLEKEMAELTSKSFPRSSYITTIPSEATKSESLGKSISKLNTKLDTKASSLTPKLEVDSRSITPNRTELKTTSHNSNSSSKSQQNTPQSIPSPSPKRTKRTRNVNSATASPATPTEPQAKRRR